MEICYKQIEICLCIQTTSKKFFDDSTTEIDLVSSVNIHVDKATGRKYSINPKTGASEWLDKTVEEAVHVDPASGRRYNSKGWL